jgi:hypothetical protein
MTGVSVDAASSAATALVRWAWSWVDRRASSARSHNRASNPPVTTRSSATVAELTEEKASALLVGA